MTLQFRRESPRDRRGRGLASEARDSYQTALAGDVEFGHLFMTISSRGPIWRWGLEFALDGDAVGHAATEIEARSAIIEAYRKLLHRARLAEARTDRQRP